MNSCEGLADGVPCDDGDPETLTSCLASVCVGVPLGRPTSCLGLPDHTACDDLDAATYSFCQDEVCESIPVPEPTAGWVLASGALLLAGSRRARRSV